MVTCLNGREQLKVLQRRLVVTHKWRRGINPISSTRQIYSGLTFKISISFPSNYPYVAPAIKFETPCFHPNFDINTGAICLDILQVTQQLHRISGSNLITG